MNTDEILEAAAAVLAAKEQCDRDERMGSGLVSNRTSCLLGQDGPDYA